MRQTIKTVMKISRHTKPAVYVKQLNTKLGGWVNYYKIAGVSQMYTTLDRLAGYLGETIYRSFRRKSQNGKSRHYRQYAYKKFIREHGLINLYKCLYVKAL